MKKKIKEYLPLIIYIIILIVFIILFILRINMTNTQKYVDYDISSCELIDLQDSRDFFTRNGEYFFQYDCSNDTSIENSIINDFKVLEKESDIYEHFFNHSLCGYDMCTEFLDDYIYSELEEPYYKFINKRTKTEELEPDEGDNITHNYSITLYDKKTKMFYYYEFKD